MKMEKTIKDARQILDAGLKAVDPYELIHLQIKRAGDTLTFKSGFKLDLSKYDRVYILGVGKGVAPMAAAMSEILDADLQGGNVIVKYGHGQQIPGIKLYEAGHPIPDENTIQSTRAVLKDTENLRSNDLVFVLLTGGGSALLEDLAEGITLSDLQALSKNLLACGATIHEINCIRKHISRIKGGQLARWISPANVVTLALSDVIGDDLSVIASGPTTPDPSTFADAAAILEKYGITGKIPDPILKHLQNGQSGKIPETPKASEPLFKSVQNFVIGSNRIALTAAAEKAKQLHYNSIILSSYISGEAREIAHFISALIREIQNSGMPVTKPACVLMGGETTVNIKGSGKGGRNQELALAVSMDQVQLPYVFISCGSDGTDGPTDAAGAYVTHQTPVLASQKNLNAAAYLDNNDSYHFFTSIDQLIKTGPTRTNVMDLMMAIIPE